MLSFITFYLTQTLYRQSFWMKSIASKSVIPQWFYHFRIVYKICLPKNCLFSKKTKLVSTFKKNLSRIWSFHIEIGPTVWLSIFVEKFKHVENVYDDGVRYVYMGKFFYFVCLCIEKEFYCVSIQLISAILYIM